MALSRSVSFSLYSPLHRSPLFPFKHNFVFQNYSCKPSKFTHQPLCFCSSSSMDAHPQGYRRNVGICLINSSKKIFAASRLDIPNSWQMPQGGIDEGEDPKVAAIRELREETGVGSAEILAEQEIRAVVVSKVSYELEKFNGKGDYNLWKTKLMALLIQQNVDLAVEDEAPMPEDMSEAQKNAMRRKAYSTIYLNLADNVCREIEGIKDPAKIWKKLDELYFAKTLTNKIYLLRKFFGFKMDLSKDLQENLDSFNKLVFDLGNCNQRFEDELIAVILLNSLPDSFDSLINVMQYGRDTLTKDMVINAIKSFNFKEKMKEGSSGEGLYARGMQDTRNLGFNNERVEGKSQSRRSQNRRKCEKMCYYCGKTGHFKRECRKRVQDARQKGATDGEADLA